MQPGQTVSPGGPPDTPNWQYKPDNPQAPNQQTPAEESSQQPAQAPSPTPTASPDGISWTASEFIAHHKSGGWYVLLALAAVAVAAGVYVFTKDKISSAFILILALIFGVSASRKPRELSYLVNDQGVQIGDKIYNYATFRSFSVVQEGNIESIWFMPLKRFMPMISIYFDPKDGDKILDILTQFLPVEEHELDAVDRLMHRLRF